MAFNLPEADVPLNVRAHNMQPESNTVCACTTTITCIKASLYFTCCVTLGCD